MTRDDAVFRINEDLGFRQNGWSRETSVVGRLQEAQRNLQKGKTLPKFLIQQDATITLTAGTHTAAYPTGFLRVSDDTRLRFFPSGSQIPTFLSERFYIDAVIAQLDAPDSSQTDLIAAPSPTSPTIYVFRPSNIDFITTADINYTIYLDYYKAADVLSSGSMTNAWLSDDAGAEWLIGEAGYRIAKTMRDKDAMQAFDDMRTAGRAACFGEDLAKETQSQPLVMGRNL